MDYKEIPILMYHEISEADSTWCISPKKFEEQMIFLKQEGYKTISLTELNCGIKKNKKTEEKLIVLTFDDARKGVYTNAYPLLKKLNFTAAIFVVPEWTDGNAPQTEQYSSFMSWDELKQLQENGFEIGSHTFSHQNLVKADENGIITELDKADKMIEKKIGKKPVHFSYPYGVYNEKIKEKIIERYMTAVTINHGFCRQPGTFARQWVTKNTPLERFKKLLKKPRLSICMITKNEEQVLGQCLLSVKALADEIIIVDTGSTDRTKEIARKFTDKVYSFTWSDDFSAARNESLKHASGDWILVIDADEMIDEQEHKKIEEAINNWESAAYSMMTMNYSEDSSVTGWQPIINPSKFTKSSLSFRGWYPSIKVRLFQRKPNVRFIGQIHEMVDKSIEGKTAALHVPIHHYGASRQKSGKYIEITEKKIAADPSDAKAQFELGVQYKEGGQFELAEKAFAECIRLGEQSAYPLLNLAIVQQKQDKIGEAIQNYKKVIGKAPNLADAHFGLGFCYFKKNDLQKAAEYFEKAVAHKPQFVDAHINLGAVYEKLERYQEAANALRNALKLSPTNARAYYNLGVIHERTANKEKAIACYKKAIELNYARKEELKEKVERMKEL